MKNRTYIIAEVGPNHLGSLLLAKQYIKVLSKTGVDAVKFQIGSPQDHYSLDSFFPKYQVRQYPKGFKLFDVVKKRLLKFQEHKELYHECKKYNIDYLCSAFDLKSLKYLNSNFKLKYFKIPSSEILSIDQLDYASKCKKDIILSTGMAQEKEIDFAINRLKKNTKNKIYNIGTGKKTTINELLKLILNLLNKKIQIKETKGTPGDFNGCYANIAKLQKDTNFSPKISLREGLSFFIKWSKKF